MIACRDKIQLGTGVIHVVAAHLIDYSTMLKTNGVKEMEFKVQTTGGDEEKYEGFAPDSRKKYVTRTHDAVSERLSNSPLVKARSFAKNIKAD